MTAPAKPRFTREEVALIEVGETDIGRRTTWVLIASFLLLITTVPVVETVLLIAAAQRAGATLGVEIARLPLVALAREPPRPTDFTFPIHGADQVDRNPLHDVEHALEDASQPRRYAQARLQEALSSALHGGNSKVVRGVDDWLFYRPGIDYVAGPAFLSEANRRIVPRRHPDPRQAIRAFARTCAEAGIRLVLVPMSDKAGIHPEKLQPGVAGPLQNPDLARLAAELETEGIELWSPDAVLAQIAAKEPAFLRQDTHWTPQAMEAVAASLATHLALPPAAHPRLWSAERRTAGRVGDLVDTLKLTPTQTLFAPQEVAISAVRDDVGAPWAPDPAADVLLLGDSFTNIYTAPQMGWGEAAGFGAQLARRLGRDLDVIAINGSGASGTRAELARQPARLLGKRVVVWQFSQRDLAVSEWNPIPIAVPTGPAAAVSAGAIRIDGRIVTTSHVPAPGGLPYADALTTLKVRVDRVVGGAYEHSEALVVIPCMRSYTLLPAASLRSGQAVSLTLVPWTTVEAVHGQTRRYDDTDEFDLPQLWAEAVDGR